MRFPPCWVLTLAPGSGMQWRHIDEMKDCAWIQCSPDGHGLRTAALGRERGLAWGSLGKEGLEGTSCATLLAPSVPSVRDNEERSCLPQGAPSFVRGPQK